VTKRPVVLCVDDEGNGLEGHRMLLENHGYTVLVATSGDEALQLFASHPTDLVPTRLSHAESEWGMLLHNA
jgi:CheY-like chemotaxis protein